MDIICRKLANEMIYAYHAGRFWRWDEGQSIWKESHLMAQKFERARAALKTLTPESFFSDGAEFALLDEYEISLDMAEALSIAKPCKNAPIDPVEEGSECTTAPTADAAATMTSPAASSSAAATPTTSASEAAANGLTPALSPQSSASAPVVPAETSFASAAAPSFDFSALGDLSQQATEADQQFDLHYGAAQDEYLISCIYLARIHALTAKAGRYGGGTWTKWYESKGLSEGSARTMVKNGDAFNSATVAELKQLPELTRKDLNLIARSGCAGQLVEAAGDSQRVQELLAQLKAKEYKLNETQARLKSACIQEQESRDAMNTANAQLEAALADIDGLQEQCAQMSQRANDAEEARIAARLQCQKAEAERDKAEERVRNAEEALKHQPIVGIVDEEEVDRRAAEKAWGLADARNAELAKDNADMKKQIAALNSKISDAAQSDFENANNIAFFCRRAWDTGKGSYSRLVGEDLETTFASLCETLNSIREEAARLCRQPPEYDGGEEDE